MKAVIILNKLTQFKTNLYISFHRLFLNFSFPFLRFVLFALIFMPHLFAKSCIIMVAFCNLRSIVLRFLLAHHTVMSSANNAKWILSSRKRKVEHLNSLLVGVLPLCCGSMMYFCLC
ncbi:hypothetical protein BpHYR1_050889 [Brachionus plicatilis]|uniref:Uncharacterized protein n=1 Tax=Brachionus plicatilis TaxID=10195 RepID=A0A3M7PQU3_BRAPC|nr:hypothetical protein BpHYR1_050889 [Brachionus plicatilis]